MTATDIPRMAAHSDIYSAVAYWGRRLEEPEALAARWLKLINRLQALDPIFENWAHWDDNAGVVPFDPTMKMQVARVIAGTERTSTGRLVPEAGSRLWNSTDAPSRSRRFTATMFAGNDNAYHDNNLTFDTDAFAVPDADVVSYRIFRGALLAMVESFDATQGCAYPHELSHLWSKDKTTFSDLNLAWISYVAPRFAHLVTPPPSAIVEYRPGGGLLMAATDETFVTANPAHLAVARDIHASLDAFNAVPRTRESGK